MSIQYGRMYYWRFKGDKEWRFGFSSRVESSGLLRMGNYNGDYHHGSIVDENEIETKEYRP